ncbi:ATPase family protein associated with various cellular activities (AAA) [Desulfitobacterium dichloroeliminans LMG P-21439]|uniref:ATPase family protein associated with various cellular activities (AAA) n=1 Tax=Desulfitobacterium dichloroeliminans (strain LMG P-21439 / DCA1) TaxID=871963 RepID=L0F7W8_DESDL|nr:ATP-binding protein [Desulfitobacterium dichloroeliminans]AGA69018.1 ATPase family protein associated with various cellular activities (AAA) [Desulfitobacterium dichloroeliminans LMG P-21439]
MNFTDTLKSVELVLATEEVPLIVGESGIGKTALAKEIARENQWSLVVINGNLLKEGEIGGLPTVEAYVVQNQGDPVEKKTTIYAVHHKLREIDEEVGKGRTVLLFIDEINRCEHTVQQELMNLILNREINGYRLPKNVKILAAMNPSSKYGADFDYQVVDMDAAQENRFVWLPMEPDYNQWIDWAMEAGIEQKVIEFISTFPEYLHKINDDDLRATPRSYERISNSYRIYLENQASIPRSVFLNVLKGNVGRLIAEEFMSFAEADHQALISYTDVFSGPSLPESLKETVKMESHTRLYLAAKNILKTLASTITNEGDDLSYSMDRLIEFLKLYPVDLKIGIMKDIKNSYPEVYRHAIENEGFVDSYFEAYRLIR